MHSRGVFSVGSRVYVPKIFLTAFPGRMVVVAAAAFPKYIEQNL